MRRVLRQIVGDGEPRRLGADEDVLARPDGRRVDERPERDVHVLAAAESGLLEGDERRARRELRAA